MMPRLPRPFATLLLVASCIAPAWARAHAPHAAPGAEPRGVQAGASKPAARDAAVEDMASRLAAQALLAAQAGRLDEARAAWIRVLEREPRHLRALLGLADLARKAEPPRLDEALWRAGDFLWQWKRLRERPADLVAPAKELEAWVGAADPLRKRHDALKRDHVTKLLEVAASQMDAGNWHGAQAVLKEARGADPDHPQLVAALARIRLEGGNELAVEDETGGSDPLSGVTAEWVAQNDPLHAEWDAAWELATEHYVVRTNAGWRVLKTVAHAMEQVHVFYRQFHRYKLGKGETVPVANVLIFKDAAEYKELGGQPVEWAAGHWDGTNVVTYDPRGGGDGGLSGLLDTLFHEASHQFTSLAGGSAVPAWLNEGMASFFEGTRLLSNGKLEWNLVVPGRLYPLLDEIKEKKHDLRAIVEGRVSDYRSYYPWGWGIVYYLHNAEDEDGTLLYRDRLPEYFQQYHEPDHMGRFVEHFVARPKVPGVSGFDEFEARFRAYILELEGVDKGTVDLARSSEAKADRQAAKQSWRRAIELYERSLKKDPGHPAVLWKLAAALEADKQPDRAAGTLRQWMSATLPAPGAEDPLAPRRAEALARIQKLDTSAKRLERLRESFHKEALALAQEYRKAGLPRIALQVLRGPATATPPSVAARDLYFAVSDESKVSLESWRLLFDERTLKGFYGGGEEDFRVHEGAILATIGGLAGAKGEGPATGPLAAGPKQSAFAYRRLFVDVEPSGDWSLSAEIDLAGARLAGLCFGKKRDDSFHGVVLLPEGHVDLGAFGTDGKTLLRVKKPWKGLRHVLRIETAGTRLVAHVDDEQVLEWTFDSRARLAGDFGLLAGDGQSAFRDIKFLEYDPGLPRRARIGLRKEAPAPTSTGDLAPLARAEPGRVAYLDEAPPLLGAGALVGDAPHGRDLDALRFRPLVLVLWSTYQESQVPVLPGLVALAEKHKQDEVAFLLVSNETEEVVRAWQASNALPFPVLCDPTNRAYEAYAAGKVGLPHAKLVGVDGRVAWEGNPDWKPEYGSYLDEPLARHLDASRWRELRAAPPRLEQADLLRAKGDAAGALAIWKELAAIATEHPAVARAKAGLAGLGSEARARIARAEELAASGRVLQAARELARVSRSYAGLEEAALAQAASAKLEGGKPWKDASRAEKKLAAPEKQFAAGKAGSAAQSVGEWLAKLDPKLDPELRERGEALLGLAGASDAAAGMAAYRARFELD